MEIAEKNVESHSNNSNGNDFGQITEAISNLHLGHEDDADLATGRIIENDTKVQINSLDTTAPSLGSTIGNLNLPHLPSSEAQPTTSSSTSVAPAPSSFTGRAGLQLSLTDLEILSTIGTGTFGRVVLVKERRLKEYFALKVMKICDIIKLKQIQHVKNEKIILSQIQHPFIVQLFWSHHDDAFLYMLLEFACGGELFSYLRNAGRFNNATSLFFASEIVLALEYLHGLHIVYRDLKPENILLDRDGHTKLTDFGFAKKVEDRTWTLCGTPEYLAPEVIQSKGHGKSVDWWALGILIYEMLAGFPPFWDESPFGIYQKILVGKINFPKNMDKSAQDLIKRLLAADRTRRIGNLKNGAQDVKRHKWFKTVDWEAAVEKKVIPPIIPKVRHSGDTRNFEDYPEDNWRTTQPVPEREISIFSDF